MGLSKSMRSTAWKRQQREVYYDPAPEGSDRANRPWTEEEDALVAAGGMSLRALAQHVGRSMKAVETRRTILRKRAAEQGVK